MSAAIPDRAFFTRYQNRTLRLRRPLPEEGATVLVIVKKMHGNGVWRKLIKHPDKCAALHLHDPSAANEEACQRIWAALEPAPESDRGFNAFGRRHRVHRYVPAIALDEPGL